jgi:hypothetical protein
VVASARRSPSCARRTREASSRGSWAAPRAFSAHRQRNKHEDVLLERFREVLPEGVKVTILADRGFGDQAMHELLKEQLGLDFVVRFRGVVKVASAEAR